MIDPPGLQRNAESTKKPEEFTSSFHGRLLIGEKINVPENLQRNSSVWHLS